MAGKKATNELTLNKIFQIIDEAKKQGAFTIGLTGGEPLLHTDLLAIIDKIYESGLQLVLTTNGTLITKNFVEKVKNKVSLFRVSIDFDNPRDHDRFRGTKGTFNRTIRAIKLLGQYQSFFQVTTLTVISKANIARTKNLIDFLESLGVKSANIFLFVPGGRGKDRKELELSHGLISHFCKLIQAEKKARTKISIHTSNPLMSIVGDNDGLCRCPAAFSSCFITETGDVIPCPYFYFGYAQPQDNIGSQSIKKIWSESPRFEDLRTEKNLNSKCISCKFKTNCFGGCRAGAFMIHNSIKEPDPMCWIK